MKRLTMTTWKGTIFALLACGIIPFPILRFVHAGDESHKVEEKKKEPIVKSEDGETVLRLDEALQKKLGIVVGDLESCDYKPETVATGRLEEDPSKGFVLRAPFDGVLRITDEASWPRVGDRVAKGVEVGWIEPRLSPLEQIDLASRHTAAQSELAQSEASLTVAKSSLEAKETLNQDAKIVTDRALEEARAKLTSDLARVQAAKATLHWIEAAQGQRANPSNALQLDRGGEITEVAVQPGEAVAKGQLLLRASNYSTMLAQVDLPLGADFDPSATIARIVPMVKGSQSLPATLYSQISRGENGTGGATFLFRVETSGEPLRPGMRVLAYLPSSKDKQSGVLIPRNAVVRDAGRAWIYVEEKEATFQRHEIPTDAPLPDGWFASNGFEPDERIVVAGAQFLLSEELKPQIEKEEVAEQ